ncbi:MAG: VWA domain-containing protein [Clostridia bacterium]|nr:VWA domain-containing protein [Clostridia bacterium]
MKKFIKCIGIIIMLVSFIMSFRTNKSYGICNTVQFTKEVSAIQLTLADGKILYDLKVEKKVDNQVNLLPESYKNLNLIFVIETQNGVAQNKAAINSFINKVYDLYGTNVDKIRMGIVPFEDLTQDEVDSRTNSINTNETILKNSKSEIINDVNNLQQNSRRTLQEALITVQNNFSTYYISQNDRLLQYMILITDGIENANINVRVNGIEQNMVDASNVVLKDLSNNNMVAMYGLLIDINRSRDANLRRVLDGVLEMTASEDLSLYNVGIQLENSVYEYINQFVIRESTLVPSGGVTDTLFTPDAIILTADEELVHGATLKIEYVMSVSRYAVYGDGTIYTSKFIDYKDDRLAFNANAKLLTEPNKTNADYGWQMTGEGLVTERGGTNTKLLLSVLLTPQQYGDSRFSNSAKCATSFDVGSGSTASYTLSDKAIDVVVLPPFGEEEKKIPIWQIATITGAVTTVIVGFCLMTRASKKNTKK